MSEGTGRSTGLRWQGCELQFLPERALWLEQEGLLLIADVHLGKAEHLQRHGIPLPSDGDAANLERIAASEVIHSSMPRPGPFAFPLLVERLNNRMSNESVLERVQRMMREAEKHEA